MQKINNDYKLKIDKGVFIQEQKGNLNDKY